MAQIEGFKIQNFRTLRDITLGRLWKTKKGEAEAITPLTAVIGKNGVGKSTLFDAFGFLSDCLKYGVEEACDMKGRGGFSRIRSQGVSEPIRFEIYYRGIQGAPITYEVAFDMDKSERPFVKSERLRQRRKSQTTGRPYSFLILENGHGVVWKGDETGIKEFSDHLEDILATESPDREYVELENNRRLGIATLGALKQHPRISAFRQFIEGWYLSYFTPDAARGLSLSGPQKRINMHGDNIGNVVQFMERDQPQQFKKILERIADRIPGINEISTLPMPDGRLLLQFNDAGFADPFSAQQMSDGTLRLFAYMLLLADPAPPPFIGIEEPENGLYHKLLEILVKEFREHTQSKKSPSQIFVTMHQPYFVDALEPKEVWILEKGADGFSTIRRASEDKIVAALVEEGLPLGGLWYSDYLDGGISNAL